MTWHKRNDFDLRVLQVTSQQNLMSVIIGAKEQLCKSDKKDIRKSFTKVTSEFPSFGGKKASYKTLPPESVIEVE